MQRALLALLFLSSALFAQPPRGPFTVFETGSYARMSDLHVTLRSADTADVFYASQNTVYHLAVTLQDGQMFAGPQELAMEGQNWTRQICDAVWTGADWAVLVYDTTAEFNRTLIYRGLDTPGDGEIVAADRTRPTGLPYSEGSYNYSLHLAPRVGGGFVAAWLNAWEYVVTQGGAREAGVSWLGMDYPPDTAAVRIGHDDFGRDYDAMLIRSVRADSVLACGISTLDSTAMLRHLSPFFEPPSVWNREYACWAPHPVGFLATPGGRLFVLANADSARLMELRNETSLLRQTTRGVPHSFAGDRNYGMAWLSGGATELYVMRVDTSGGMFYLPGLLATPRSGFHLGESTLGMATDGFLASVWLENGVQDTSRVQLRIISLSPYAILDAGSSFIPHPSSFILSSSPNPFNGTLRIEYTLPHAGPLELSIYNVLGQKIEQLISGPQIAGSHTLMWTPQCGTGIYFVMLKSADAVRTSKVVYLK
ncbi:MAG TPA: T9SS type A sorting domain-containing protein [bacterium]|jgi:hypothetical protein